MLDFGPPLPYDKKEGGEARKMAKKKPFSTISDPVLRGLTPNEREHIRTLSRNEYLIWYKTRRATVIDEPILDLPSKPKPEQSALQERNRAYLAERARLFKNRNITRTKMLEEFVPIRSVRLPKTTFSFYDLEGDERKYYLLASPAGEIFDVLSDRLLEPRLKNLGTNHDTVRYQVLVRVRNSSGMYNKCYISVDKLIAAAFMDVSMHNKFPLFTPGVTHKLMHRDEDLMNCAVENLFYIEVDMWKTMSKARNMPFVADLPNLWEGE